MINKRRKMLTKRKFRQQCAISQKILFSIVLVLQKKLKCFKIPCLIFFWLIGDSNLKQLLEEHEIFRKCVREALSEFKKFQRR